MPGRLLAGNSAESSEAYIDAGTARNYTEFHTKVETACNTAMPGVPLPGTLDEAHLPADGGLYVLVGFSF